VHVDQSEGRGEPEAAPARGERAGARGVLGWEAEDDVLEDLAGEAADAVDAIGGSLPGGGGGEARGAGDGRVRDGDVHEPEGHGHAHPQQIGIVQATGLPQIGLKLANVVAHERLELRDRRWRALWFGGVSHSQVTASGGWRLEWSADGVACCGRRKSELSCLFSGTQDAPRCWAKCPDLMLSSS
jgi:hypothetical protein